MTRQIRLTAESHQLLDAIRADMSRIGPAFVGATGIDNLNVVENQLSEMILKAKNLRLQVRMEKAQAMRDEREEARKRA